MGDYWVDIFSEIASNGTIEGGIETFENFSFADIYFNKWLPDALQVRMYYKDKLIKHAKDGVILFDEGNGGENLCLLVSSRWQKNWLT